MYKFLSWLAITFGIIYFFYETWYHISYDQSNLALTQITLAFSYY